MTLAIFRSEGLSGVSNEVVKTIREVLPLPRDIDVFRNATKWNLRADRDVNLPRTAHALIVSRSQKLGHLRAGFDLFARAYWSGLVKRLIIISATPPGAIPLKGRFLAASGLLGLSWCFSKGFKFLFPLLATRVVPATYPLDPFFQKAELVLGMGRVVVEGLAWGKKCVLIGYERAIDLVDADNFSSLAESNFSGRQCVALSPECIISRLANHQRPPKESDILPFQIENAAARVQAALVRDSRKAIHNRDCILAKKLAHALVEGESDAKIFRLAFQNLQPSEMECFYRLTAG
jgi:hypothetical protein